MARIVIIHGINNETEWRHTLKGELIAPLCDGIERELEWNTALPSQDFEVVFWGDLFRDPARLLSAGPP